MNILGYNIKMVRNSITPQIPMNTAFMGGVSFDTKDLAFARVDLASVLKMLFDRISKAEFTASVNFMAAQECIALVAGNMEEVILSYLKYGLVIIDLENFEIVKNPIRYCINGKVVYPHRCIYESSQCMKLNKVSDFAYLAPKTSFLDAINNSDFSLIENYGAMGILSPQAAAAGVIGGNLDDEDKKAIQDEYNNSYGLKFGKWKLLISRVPLSYSQINLPIAALQLSEKRRALIGDLLAYFGVPKELHPAFENSKYNNLQEAEVQFYSNAVSAWCDFLLDLIRRAYTSIRLEKDLDPVEFYYDFVGVLSLEEKKYTEIQRAQEQLNFWKEILIGTYPEDLKETARQRIDNLIDTL